MRLFLLLAALLLCVLASGVFSGSETGLYSLSRLRVEAAGPGPRQRSARIIRRLLRDDAGLLITLLVGNNLANQVATHLGNRLLAPFSLPAAATEVVLTLVLTPPLFFFGELVPKDLFRRRPHAMVGICAPLIALVKLVLLPLTVPLRLVTRVAERLLGLDAHELARVQGHEALLDFLRAGEHRLPDHMETMARNVLELRRLRLPRVMVPWRRVEVLDVSRPDAELHERVAKSAFTRLPVVDGKGAVKGYVHQLEVLAGGRDRPIASHLRPMIAFEPNTPLDRALARLRLAGQRAALVGTPTSPQGLVTLKDLVEEISGELHRW